MKKQRVKALNFETANYTRDELSVKLLEEAKKKNIIYRIRRQFKSNEHFYSIYSTDELMSILNITITKVLNSFDVYKLRKQGIVAPEGSPTISEDLDLDSFGNLTGYMIEAFKKNFSKDYKKHTADKRSGDCVSIDGTAHKDEKESHLVFNQLKIDTIKDSYEKIEYARVLNIIFSFLREYDKKNNASNVKKSKKDKTSKFAYLFLYIIDPKYKGKFVNIKDKFQWSPYLYEQNKQKMINLIKENFKDEISFLFDYIAQNNTQYGETIRPKKTKTFFDQSCETTTMFEEKYSKVDKTVTVTLNCLIYRLENGQKKIIDTIKFEKTGPTDDVFAIREALKVENNSSIDSMKKVAQTKRHNALKEIYAA